MLAGYHCEGTQWQISIGINYLNQYAKANTQTASTLNILLSEMLRATPETSGDATLTPCRNKSMTEQSRHGPKCANDRFYYEAIFH